MNDILNAKEKRVQVIETLLNSNQVILCLRANYPGENKDNETTRKLIGFFDDTISKTFTLSKKLLLNDGEGFVYLYLIDTIDYLSVKEQAIELEEHHNLGRFVDLDVYYQSIRSISRASLNKKGRTCFLCDKDAFICIREQNHSIEELTAYIKRVVDCYA